MRSLRELLDGFVRPLVAGQGAVHVGEPIDEEQLAGWTVHLDEHAALLEEIDGARAALARELVLTPPRLIFGEAELRLAVALHDMFVLAHPASAGVGAGKGRRNLAALARELAAAPPPADRREVLARHTLLANLFHVQREDVLVAWWSGHAQFQGEEPPKRLLRWASVRRVQSERTLTPVADVLAEIAGDGEDVVAALLAASPLTDLLSLPEPLRDGPPFRWSHAAAVLEDAELARAVAYAWLDDLPPAEAAPAKPREAAARLRAAGAGAAAWEQAVANRAEPADLRRITAFLVHVATLAALAETGLSALDGPSPLIQALFSGGGAALPLSERGDPQVRGAQLLFALPEAAERADPALARPPGLDATSPLGRRYAAHRAHVRATVGEARLKELAGRLAEALAR